MHPLGLEPEHHDDVAILEALAHIVMNLNPEPVCRYGKQGRRRNHADPGPHDVQELDVRPGDAAMQNVPADRYCQTI